MFVAKVSSVKDKISESLLDMLSQKNIDEITVGEFIEFANVSRSTFYRYYHDIYDVYDSLIEVFANRCMKNITLLLTNREAVKHFAENITPDWRVVNKEILGDSDFRFFNHIINGNLSTPILKKLDFYFTRLFYQYLVNNGLEADKADFYSKFILKSLLAAYSYGYSQGRTFCADPLNSAFKIIDKLRFKEES